MPPLVSFCVSNHNYARYLAEVLDGLLAQTYSNTEIIVVDDGSTDDSREVLERYRDRIIVEYLDTAHGQPEACNRAFVLSHGEIVVFHDSDDALHPDAAARLVDAFAADDGVMVLSRLEDIDQDGRRTGGMRPPDGCPLWGGDLRELVLDHCAFFWTETTGQAFRRSFLEDVLPMPTSLAPDMYLSHLGALATPVIALQEPIGSYRVHGLNITMAPRRRGLPWLDNKIEEREILHQAMRAFGTQRGLFADEDEARRWTPRDYIMASLRLTECRLAAKRGRWRWGLRGIRSIIDHRQFSFAGRANHIAWFVGVTVLPAPLARRLVQARFPFSSSP
jgi:glycosyltransferase involved in cell wall biosynthesis